MVYSPLDAVKIAQENPEKQVVFFAIGFETTAPVNAMSVVQAQALGLSNYSILVSQVCVPPAMHAILGSPQNRVQGFLAAGHVCAVMGTEEYDPIAAQYHVPIVVTGFEPLDLAQGILMTVEQLEAGKAEVGNAYTRVVTREGNRPAQALLKKVFEPVDRNWRGIGMIPMSGLGLAGRNMPPSTRKNASAWAMLKTEESPLCIAGLVLQGVKKPVDCPAFGKECTPTSPLGAPMVSAEGACAAYYRYQTGNVEVVIAVPPYLSFANRAQGVDIRARGSHLSDALAAIRQYACMDRMLRAVIAIDMRRMVRTALRFAWCARD